MNIKIKTIAFLLTSLFCIQLLACTQESETQAIKNQNESTKYLKSILYKRREDFFEQFIKESRGKRVE